jgi:UDP-glucose 4-epimerase
MQTEGFFRKKKVVVTGGAGFIGSHIVDKMLEAGSQVTVIDDFSSGREQNLSAASKREGFRLIRGSVCDLEMLQQHLAGVDYVFHQAAVASVPLSIENPRRSHEVNLTGSLNVLLAARNRGVKRVILASSSAVYGDSPAILKQETQVPCPQSPYALTKLGAEYYCQIFGFVYGLSSICLRYFNVYGPRQDLHSDYAAVIPRFILALQEGKSPIIFGDGQQTRDFIFVKDVVSANLEAAAGSSRGNYNIASGRAVSLNELTRVLSELMGRSDIAPRYTEERAGDIKHSRADVSLARETGFAARYELEAGLSETIEALQSQP